MKIKTQLSLLIVCIALLPVLCATSLPLYHYFTSPQRYLIKSFKEVRSIESIKLTEDDWDELERMLKDVPPNVQIAVYYNQTVIISNLTDLKAGSHLAPNELFDLIRSTNNKYNYQFQAPFSSKRHIRGGYETIPDTVFVISRSPVSDKRKVGIGHFLLPAFVFLIVFEAACITIIISLLKNITSSITAIERDTQKIASGELNTAISATAKKNMPNELKNLALSLEKMRESLKDDQERRVKFIMGISHDLRTPVALIKGYTEAITDGVVNDMTSVKKSLAIIHTKADLLEGMINDLINYVKLNNTDWRQTLGEEDLYTVISEFTQGAQAAGDVYNRKISTKINLESGIKVQMDKKLFGRAVENILSNALRYTKEGDSIFIKAWHDEEKASLSIGDTGKGIAQKDLEHIWDLFYRGTSSRRESGFGIGLSVVKTIIDTHGWSIKVESEEGKGSVFTIEIPLKNL